MFARSTALIFLFAVAIGSAAHDVPRNTRYLALGDSVAFGFSPLIAPTDTGGFFGYPDLVSKALHKKVTNASCFGESSGSFLTLGALDRGCAVWRSAFPLQADYSGTQMQYALAYLAANAKKTDLVTISLGANDLGVLLFTICNGDVTCGGIGLAATLGAYNANIVAIFSAIRAVYDGPIVAVNAYAVNYANPVELQGLIPLNGVLASAASAFLNIQVADAFGAFRAATSGTFGDSCDAGLLIRRPDDTCDIHPSEAGHALIAEQVLGLVPKK